MWAFLPDTWLVAIGFSYLPHKSVDRLSHHTLSSRGLHCRYWAVAVPSFIIVSTLVGVVMYAGLNCTMVTSFSDPRTVQGIALHKVSHLQRQLHSNTCIHLLFCRPLSLLPSSDPSPQFPSSQSSQPHSIPPLTDLDISLVNRALYRRHTSSRN